MRRNKGITLVSLVVTIIVLIILAGVSINLTLGENGIITVAKKAKENIELAKVEEETRLNELYTQIEVEGGATGEVSYDAIAKIEELKDKIASLEAEKTEKEKEIIEKNTIIENLNQTTAEAGHILKGYKAYSKGKLLTGTMVNQGAKATSLNAGGSYTIPAGYHNGQGKVTAKDLASQTQATATAKDIVKGKTAYVDGSKITGTLNIAEGYNNVLFSRKESGTYATSVNTSISIPQSTNSGKLVINCYLVNATYQSISLSLNNGGKINQLYNTTSNRTNHLVSFVYEIKENSSNKINVTINHSTTGGGFSLLDLIFLY